MPGQDDRPAESVAAALTGIRPTWVEVDLEALSANLATLRRLLGPARRIVAVVKADAYGHGLVPVARRLQRSGADALGVAIAEEGEELRQSGVDLPILVLGAADPSQIPAMVESNLIPVAFSLTMLDAILGEARRLARPVPFHLKLDTGMGRLGLLPSQLLSALSRIAAGGGLARMEGVFTHLSCADAPADPHTAAQLARFRESLAAVRAAGFDPPWIHSANSGGILNHPDSWLSAVRPGIALFGVCPSPESADPGLRPVLSFKSRLIRVERLPAGAVVGYGHAFVLPRPGIIGTIAAGYADGLCRLLSNRGEALVRGRRAPLVGRVSMDLAAVELTGIEGAAEGDEVVLLGRQGDEAISAEQFARWSDTIPYEALCRLGQRAKRIYLSAEDSE